MSIAPNNTQQAYLDQTLELAELRRGFCAPNPAVGAIVVKDQEVIGTGYHWATGYPHAEQMALEKAGKEAKGASLYISLEPCCHWGRTPPCTEAIIQAGIKEVFFASIDPNPLVSGQSIPLLQQAGIRCQQYARPKIDTFYHSYQHWTKYKRPWLTAKLALSLDGKIAGVAGQPVKITGKPLQEKTHQRRRLADAILTTAATLNRDDPMLNVRLSDEIIKKPVYVLDSQLSLNDALQIYHTTAHLVLLHNSDVADKRREELEARGVQCVTIPTEVNGNDLDLQQVLSYLGEEGLHDVWVEAGGQCFEALFRAGLLNQALIYIAAKTLGEEAYSAFHGAHRLLDEAKQYEWQQVGHDMLCQLDF